MTRNLITGASGFIGGHLARSLVKQGQQVRCLVRQTSKIDHLRDLDIEFVTGDILDPGVVAAAVAGVDRVYHAAGLVTAIRSVSFHEVNTKGTANVVRVRRPAAATSADSGLLRRGGRTLGSRTSEDGSQTHDPRFELWPQQAWWRGRGGAAGPPSANHGDSTWHCLRAR